MVIWTLSLAALAALGWGMVKLADDVQLPTGDGTLTVPVSESDNIMGPASASVTLLEYGDFQCPACAAIHPIVLQLFQEPELQGKLRFVFRHFPLPMHKNAPLASRAAQAAGVHGKFWEMHAKLYETQTAWSGKTGDGARDAFMEYARALEINTEWFAGDLDSDEVKAKVDADVESGNAAGVNSTPTFFVNGKLMPLAKNYEEFKQFIVSHVTP